MGAPGRRQHALAALAVALPLVLGPGCTAEASRSAPLDPGRVTVTIVPARATLYWSQSLPLAAVVGGAQPQAVTWSVDPADAGSITAGGLYTAPARSGTFEIRATSLLAPTAFGAATVTVLPPPPAGVPMTTAHRTSGVAPLAVFFDAVDDTGASAPRYRFAWSSGVAQPADLEGASWSWDFGDPGSGTWSTTGRPRNVATGFTAAHVYETPGTYTATLVVTDPTTLATVTYSQTITVADPSSVFASTTRYVAAPAAGGRDDNPGTEARPYATIGRAMADVAAGTAKRVLLRRGDTFAVSTSYAISAAGPGLVGPYGTGTRPVVQVAELGDTQAFATRAADWRFVDLDFRGAGNTSSTGPVGPYPQSSQAVDVLALRLSTQGFYVGVGWGYYGETGAGTPHDGLFLVECDEPVAPGAYGAYVGGRRLALLGNTLRGGTGDAHALRLWQGHKLVVSNNVLRDPGAGRHALKLHGIEPAFPSAPETRWASITDNLFHAGASQWTISLGSQSTAAAEAALVSHVLLERNRFTASASTVADLQSEASNAVVRNNVFDDSPGSGVTTCLWQQRNASVEPPRDVRVYNNTAYGAATFLGTDSTLANARLRNNLAATPGATPALVSGSPGSGFAQDHNVLTGAAADAVFARADEGDFSLPAGSPGVDAGTRLGEVPQDLLLRPRPAGAGWDAGAVESR